MNAITVPAGMVALFRVNEETQVCDETGRVLGFYTPVQTPLPELTDEQFEWVAKQMTPEFLEASLNSGVGRSPSQIIADLQRKYGK
ncbi:MAG: hypothetical protein SFU86_20685 [Pirellulaceae bacterium]|nr:hypothetical protein [Pirellulaceae bacterium]